MKSLLITILATMSFCQSVFADGSVYGMGGVGRTSKGESTGHQGGAFGFRRDINNHSDIDFLYYNEGTPTNDHRDGFAVMGWEKKSLTPSTSVEAGVGPYLSMNTTTLNGEQKNQKKVGALIGLAVLHQIYGSNVYLTARYTHAAVPGAIDTDTIFVGGGYRYSEKSTASADLGETEVSVMGGNSKATREGTEMATGYQIEVRRLATARVAYSVTIIDEGNNGVTDRTGAGAQVWYVVPTEGDQWTLSVGTGPYISRDKLDDGKTRASLATSMEVARKIAKNWKVAIRFTRATSSNNKDQDMFYVGFQRKFR